MKRLIVKLQHCTGTSAPAMPPRIIAEVAEAVLLRMLLQSSGLGAACAGGKQQQQSASAGQHSGNTRALLAVLLLCSRLITTELLIPLDVQASRQCYE
jgi:hypothetical protein